MTVRLVSCDELGSIPLLCRRGLQTALKIQNDYRYQQELWIDVELLCTHLGVLESNLQTKI